MKKSLGARTLLCPTPVMLVGTYDHDRKPNLMTAAWGGICCSQPPCIAVSLRKATYSYACIVERKAFTVGIASENQVKTADYMGLCSGRDVNKFVEMGLSVVKSDLVDAPYAAEIPLVLECRLMHTLEIGMHTQFVGEIVDVKVDATVLSQDSLPDILKLRPIVYDSAHRAYHGVGPCLGEAFSVGKK
jgi:flavin reductase (DIM6/NTAB) family NADH-FMN oxidoreductase RutF